MLIKIKRIFVICIKVGWNLVSIVFNNIVIVGFKKINIEMVFVDK